jgi:hypothetical protein
LKSSKLSGFHCNANPYVPLFTMASLTAVVLSEIAQSSNPGGGDFIDDVAVVVDLLKGRPVRWVLLV